MKHRYSINFIGFIGLLVMISGALKAQNANPLIHSTRFRNPANNSKSSALHAQSVPADAVEDISKRTLFSSTWKTKSGKVISRFSSVILNYPDANGNLQAIDLTLKTDPKGWVADKQPNPCYLHSDRSTAISVGQNQEFVFNKNCTINGMPLDQHILSMENSDVKLDMSQGVHKEISFVTNGIKTNYVFDSLLEGGINIAEELEFPDGCTFQKDDKVGSAEFGGWVGDYILLAPDGKQVLARFQSAECYDAAKHLCFASYTIEKKEGKNILKTVVPAGWLAKAVYPVTVDPLVVGKKSIWGGGTTGSGLYTNGAYNNYIWDSIRITIPPKITISFFTIDYAYVSFKGNFNNQSIPINQGIFVLYDSCTGFNPNDTSSCMDETGGGHGDTAGICYLVPNSDFHNPFTCCHPPSCDTQKFWLYAGLARRHGADFPPDTDFIWYSKGYGGYVGPQYQFSAWLEGYTDSLLNWSVTPATQCSNHCSLTLKATAGFGVPPYKISHPWASSQMNTGLYASCISEGSTSMKLTIPSNVCPYTCGTAKTISVPAPTVVDACGDTATPWKPIQLVLNPVPIISFNPDTVKVCSGIPLNFNLLSCVSGTSFNWKGSDNTSNSGTDSLLTDKTLNNSNHNMIVNYIITGSANGCNATDTVKATGIIYPNPIVTINGNDSILLGNSETITASGGSNYSWEPTTRLSCHTCPNPVASPTVTTTYTVTVTDSGKVCERTSTFTIIVLDENVHIPNVITPNAADFNSIFFISNLQDYPNSKLDIYNRWGRNIYSTSNYQNNWNGGGESDGVYYYALTLSNGKRYNGFVQLINKP